MRSSIASIFLCMLIGRCEPPPERPPSFDADTLHRFIHLAATTGGKEMTDLLGDHPDLINAQADSGDTALWAAAKQGRFFTVTWLIDQGAEVDLLGRMLETPLGAAASGGHAQVAGLLLIRGADANGAAGQTLSPLQLAVQAQQWGVADLLLSKGATIDVQSAAGLGRLDLVRELFPAYTNLDAAWRGWKNPLSVAVAAGHTDVVEWLLDQPHYDDRETALQYLLVDAIEWDRIEMLEFLLDRGVPAMEQDNQHRVPIVEAARRGNIEAFDLLLERGADLLQEDVHRRNALTAAVGGGMIFQSDSAYFGRLHAHELLVQRIIKLSSQDARLAAHFPRMIDFAAAIGHLEVVRLLVDHVPASQLAEAVAHAATEDHRDVLALLLAKASALPEWSLRGAVHARKHKVLTMLLGHEIEWMTGRADSQAILSFAYASEDLHAARMLLEAGAPVDVQDEDGNTMLFHIASNYDYDDDHEWVSLLLEFGADPTQRNDSGMTVLDALPRFDIEGERERLHSDLREDQVPENLRALFLAFKRHYWD